mmetsp:Transcript_25018/g.75412  ORF Transcript_25018/g.75412 Transcript_25018/m.75412 type:complete len:108 (+) Transcript_25018:172-495(+)
MRRRRFQKIAAPLPTGPLSALHVRVDAADDRTPRPASRTIHDGAWANDMIIEVATALIQNELQTLTRQTLQCGPRCMAASCSTQRSAASTRDCHTVALATRERTQPT